MSNQVGMTVVQAREGLKCGTTGSENFNQYHVIWSLNELGDFKLMSHTSILPEALPFPQRKPVFSIRFLLVGVPYHSEYLDEVNLVTEEDFMRNYGNQMI